MFTNLIPDIHDAGIGSRGEHPNSEPPLLREFLFTNGSPQFHIMFSWKQFSRLVLTYVEDLLIFNVEEEIGNSGIC